MMRIHIDLTCPCLKMFRVRTSKTVESRNATIEATNSAAPLIPLEFGDYAKTLECTHGGAYVSRGHGKRPRQETRSMECPAQVCTFCMFSVCVQIQQTVQNVLNVFCCAD